MELPQPRPFGTQGRKPAHDFLSLYNHQTLQQDPTPSPSSGGYLKTHDFLKPLERGGKTEEATAAPSGEHVLPGGIGTYSISHISYFNPKAPKPEGEMFTVGQGSVSTHEKNDENSNCSSFSGSGFALWEESGAKKGRTGKETAGESGVGMVSPWATSREIASNSATSNHRNSFTSRSSSQPSILQKSSSFVEMMKSANCGTQDDDFDDDEDFGVKKESSTTTTIHNNGGLSVKVDGKSASGPDQKANTPRSKHSATEQRRRSKINDRFQMLREIIPNSDQKRDKASFLLEVVEYIQFLQDKVNKYEESYPGWNHEPAKLTLWENNQRTVENHVEQSQAGNRRLSPTLAFSSKINEKNISVPPTLPGTAQTPAESNISPATPFKGPVTTNQPMPFPGSLQSNFFNSPQSIGAAAQLPLRLASSDAEINAYTSNGAVLSDKLKEQGLTIESGTINLSSHYSQRLLNTLTKALQSCGVDLSKAGISVQIELGKQTPSIHKDNDVGAINQGMTRSRVSCSENSDKVLKKQKTGKS